MDSIEVLRPIATTLQKDNLPSFDKEDMVNESDDDLTDYGKVDCTKSYFLNSSNVSSHQTRLYVLHSLDVRGVDVKFDKDELFRALCEIIGSVIACYPLSSSDSVRSGFYEAYVVFVKSS